MFNLLSTVAKLVQVPHPVRILEFQVGIGIVLDAVFLKQIVSWRGLRKWWR